MQYARTKLVISHPEEGTNSGLQQSSQQNKWHNDVTNSFDLPYHGTRQVRTEKYAGMLCHACLPVDRRRTVS
jgi:hypothetical protein